MRGLGDVTASLRGSLQGSFRGSLRRSLRIWRRAALGRFVRPHAAPIFVLGNQKSGTTAIAALLARMTGLRATLDLRREIDTPTFQRVHAGQWTMERFVERNRFDFSRDLIKEPNLTLLCGPLRDYFPQGRFVFVVRDPRQCIRSILDRLGLPGNSSELNGEQLAGVSPAWRLVLDGRWMGLAGDQYVDLLAERWNRCARVYLDDPERFTLCRYEDFVRDRAGTIADLARALSLPVLRDISSEVESAFQPTGRHRHTPVEEFFGDNLDRVTRICADPMHALGYSTEGTAT